MWSTISRMPWSRSAEGSRRMSSTERSPTPGQPSTITSWPAARKRPAHVSQLFGVIHRPWIRTMGVFAAVVMVRW